jgi:hypothetical protein
MFSLASGVFLRLDRDAMLLGSTKSDDYPAAGWNWDPALVDTVSVNSRRALCGPPRHAHDERWHGLDWLREHTSVFVFPARPFVDELTMPLSGSHCICVTRYSGPASVSLGQILSPSAIRPAVLSCSSPSRAPRHAAKCHTHWHPWRGSN